MKFELKEFRSEVKLNELKPLTLFKHTKCGDTYLVIEPLHGTHVVRLDTHLRGAAKMCYHMDVMNGQILYANADAIVIPVGTLTFKH